MINTIQEIVDRKRTEAWWKESYDKVVFKYGKLFNPSNLENLTREDFKSFLLLKNNYHWEGIHRQGNVITSNMKELKKFLGELLDESQPIRERLEKLFDNHHKCRIRGLGRAVLTPILMVVYPDKYGVWNSRSEDALKKLNYFPEFNSKDEFAERYLRVNATLHELAEQHGISLWHLDSVLGDISGSAPFGTLESEEEIVEKEVEVHGIADLQNFGMEKHLEDFLITNWDKTFFGKKYDLIYEEGDLLSQQYATSVGPIDLLAISKDKKEYLVLELKKGRSSDSVVGQILRYMAWVKKNLAKDQDVKGAVVVLDADEKIEHSLAMLKNIDLYTYQVSFSLSRVENALF